MLITFISLGAVLRERNPVWNHCLLPIRTGINSKLVVGMKICSIDLNLSVEAFTYNHAIKLATLRACVALKTKIGNWRVFCESTKFIRF